MNLYSCAGCGVFILAPDLEHVLEHLILDKRHRRDNKARRALCTRYFEEEDASFKATPVTPATIAAKAQLDWPSDAF